MRVKPAESVKLFSGIIAGDRDLIGEMQKILADMFGPVDVESRVIPFDLTDYYEDEMGSGLFRKFVAFQNLISPEEIADIKLKTNGIEERLGVIYGEVLKRRVNIDPGYIAPAKVVLATTKDFSHRIYLGRGIYGEVTFGFRKKEGCVFFDWTFPDFKSGRYNDFFIKARERLLARDGAR